MDWEAWRVAVLGVAKSWTGLSDWTELTHNSFLTPTGKQLAWLRYGIFCMASIPREVYILWVSELKPSGSAILFMYHASLPLFFRIFRVGKQLC